ncbi:MAG: DUF1788 domain-containing protein [Anaerovibrio sp.]|uniref:DUF1788 domain-containing protein n=1 Tax=Anaerovibrio sp. TaxID=1872532 RepID=UPI001B096323|nr:DUF1788 domain-containing protein [Anaerovibrio sp.]MBO6245501.1 DUF1788 domain-containing protein [Anaerovibrio sp.]
MPKTLLRNDTYEEINNRLDRLKEKVHDPDFISSKRKANEVNCWVFDYPPEHEMVVRERLADMVKKNKKGLDSFQIFNFDLYDIIMDYLEEEGFFDQCDKYEEKYGIQQVSKSVKNVLRLSMEDNLLTDYIKEHTPTDNAVVFLTGVGKCYPLLQATEILNKVLYNMPASYNKVPMIVFYPGTYTEQELILFNKIHEDNYYRAFRIVRD